jgi:hypothetical protein
MNVSNPAVTPGLGILMILVSAAAVAGAVGAVFLAVLRRRPAPVAAVTRWLGAWAALYAVVLVTVSARSEPHVLGHGEDQRFCGFYIDCHSQIAVLGVETLDSLPGVQPAGRFYVVSLRVSSDAKVARMRLLDPRLTVRDASGRRYERSPAAEAALAAARGPLAPLTDPVEPGGSYATAVVFDLPRDVADPRLRVSQGWWADRLIEFFLVGDEDSFLHRKTTFRLDA